MIIHCIKCDYTLSIPDFSNYEKSKILEIMNQNSDLKVIPLIHEMTKLSMKDSKALCFHINKLTGHCHRCNYDRLVGENVTCPKCKSLNLNWNNEK